MLIQSFYSLSEIDCHTDCYIAKSAVTTLLLIIIDYIASSSSVTYALEPTCARDCYFIVLDIVVAFLRHGRSTGSMHAFHKGPEMEHLEPASPTTKRNKTEGNRQEKEKVEETRSTQRAQTSTDPEDPDFGLWTPGSEV